MEIMNKDILTVKNGIICHQVNCKGVMGAGLALQIKNKWPIVYDKYIWFWKTQNPLLGKVLFVEVDKNLIIANMFSQNTYKERNFVHTNYEAMIHCFKTVNEESSEEGLKIYVPYKIGCGLAGGSWLKVIGLIEKYIPNSIICEL